MPIRPRFGTGFKVLLVTFVVYAGVFGAQAQESDVAGIQEPIATEIQESDVLGALEPDAAEMQDSESAGAETSGTVEPVEGIDDLYQNTLSLDIASSDYYALVAWVRQLGLPDDGTSRELRDKLYEFYAVTPPATPASSTRTITIVSADRTEYIAAREESESTVRFSGRVSLSVKDDNSGETLTIDADEVLVNRDANIISARGDIIFERKKPDGSDFFMGEALELDMDDWSGVFIDGESTQGAGADAGADTLFFRADDIIKRGTDVLVFKDGIVSSCDDEDPHYSIRASKIWILGGNEWAMQNMTLSVGEVPLLYLPFFYYPGEEIVFNPVFGYDGRFGRYVQTTTYLLGEKAPKEQEISLLKITEGGGGYERKIDGVFLRTSRDKKKGSTTDVIKVLVDLYSNLGGMIASQAQVASLGPFKSITGFAGIALSRSLFPGADELTYTPFAAAANYRSVLNAVDFFGTVLPFRFGWDFTSSLEAGPLRLSIAVPFYSDSFFNKDFKDRTENMNWLQFLDQEQDETPVSKLSTFTDSLSASATVPSTILPLWLSTVSLSRLAPSLSWNATAKTAPAELDAKALFDVDPAREFFAPYEWTIADVGASLSGTLFKFPYTPSSRPAPMEEAGSAVVQPEGIDPQLENGAGLVQVNDLERYLSLDPVMVVPWEEAARPESMETGELPGFNAPKLASPEKVTEREPFSTSLGWSYSPTLSWKRRFLNAAWKQPSDVDWSALYETRTVRNAGTLSLSGALYEGLLGITAGASASTQFQDRPLYSDDAAYVDDSLLSTWARQDAQYRNDKISGSIQLKSQPLQSSWLWSPTGVTYNLSSLLYERAFESMDAEAPADVTRAIYKEIVPDWTDETVTAHALSLILGLKPQGYVQSLTMTADLPPLLEAYKASLSLKSLWASFSVGTAYAVHAVDEAFKWDLVNASLTLGAAPWPVVGSSLSFDTETSLPTSITANIAWSGISASLSAKEAITYDLAYGSGWTAAGDAAFRLASATFALRESWKPPAAWRRRIQWTVDVNAEAQQSFLRFTDSSASFIFGTTFKVHEFLDITFSSTSRNSSLWRYYPGLFNLPAELDVDAFTKNPVVDILQSFNFFDSTGESRREALFKLKSLSINATHHLHDWDLSLVFSANPVLDDNALEYSFKTNISILLAWNSVSQIKSSYSRTGETVKWD